MNADHMLRLNASADKLAFAISEQARSLAMFPLQRLDLNMVEYDLLARTMCNAVMSLVIFTPDNADRMVDHLAGEVHVLIDEWRKRHDAEEAAANQADPE